jgi:hypothetical protein
MNTKFVAAIAVLTAVTTTVAFAQDEAGLKVTKAEVQKVVDNIKADQTKFSRFCDYAKLVNEASALAEKGTDESKVEALNNQVDEIISKSGPEAERILNADLDDDSIALLQDLAKTCK